MINVLNTESYADVLHLHGVMRVNNANFDIVNCIKTLVWEAAEIWIIQ